MYIFILRRCKNSSRCSGESEKSIALGGMETFGAISKPVQDDSKPKVPFMVMKEIELNHQQKIHLEW